MMAIIPILWKCKGKNNGTEYGIRLEIIVVLLQ